MPSSRRTVAVARSLGLVLALAVVAAAAPSARAGGGGTIRGSVRYLGTPKPAAPADRSSDPACPQAAGPREDVVVTGGKLRDVHVAIQSGTAGKHAAPKAPISIEQTGCTYRPRVVGAIAGQGVVIKNGDALMHNVHAFTGDASAWNRGQPKGSPPITRADVGPAGQVLTLKCDVHPWMRAFVVVTDHPFFAVSGDDGGFVIADVPPGDYTLEAYHPMLGTKRKPVHVAAGATATVDLIFP